MEAAKMRLRIDPSIYVAWNNALSDPEAIRVAADLCTDISDPWCTGACDLLAATAREYLGTGKIIESLSHYGLMFTPRDLGERDWTPDLHEDERAYAYVLDADGFMPYEDWMEKWNGTEEYVTPFTFPAYPDVASLRAAHPDSADRTLDQGRIDDLMKALGKHLPKPQQIKKMLRAELP